MPSEALVDLLVKARRNGHQIAQLPEALVPATADDGYAVADRVSAALGWAPLGWKIAGTTESVRKRLGLHGPIYGRTFQRFRYPSPARLQHAALLDPLVECEFFVTLGRDLPSRPKPWTMDELIEAIATVHAGIEVAECRFLTASMPPLPAVYADGCASGRYIYGGEIVSWRAGLSGIDVRLAVDGQPRRTGKGADVMGDPLVPLLWLVERLRQLGRGLVAGEMISTGSCTGMLPVRTGQTVHAVFGGTAEVLITFDG